MLYTLSNGRFTAEVNDHGAELTSLKDASGRSYLWCGDRKYWHEHSPLLFPVVGRLTDDRYFLGEKKYDMPKHGFLKNEDFRVVEQTQEKIVLRYDDWQKYSDCFPFRYAVEITHEMTECGVRSTHKVINLDDETMYFSFGAHPGINCVDGGELRFEKTENVRAYHFDNQQLIDEDTLPFLENASVFPIDLHTFDHGPYILENLNSSYIDVCPASGEYTVRVSFPGVPVVGLWAARSAPYVCVEPWYGIDDDHFQTGQLSEKKQIVTLPGKQEFSFSIAVEVVG